MRPGVWLSVAAAVWSVATLTEAQRSDAFGASRDHEAIAYSTAAVSNAVTRLNERLQREEVTLTFDEDTGYLRSVLEALSVPVESQVLVFSPTSFQARRITQSNPRALYFSDSVAVGFVRGGDLLEVMVQDPRQGAIFYTLPQTAASAPSFIRDDKCLSCHLSWDTRAVPGPFVQTVFPRRTDDEYANGFIVDHRVPLAERWGGWYVTGARVPVSMANQDLLQPRMPASGPAPAAVAQTSLGDVAGRGYLSAFSDVIALLVLEHQAHAINLMTRAGWEHRIGSPHVRAAVDELVDYLLFVDEAPLPHPIKGSSGFAEKFAALGPNDGHGRSLRQFDLDTRLMRYPLSYMIYSPGFAGLPPEVRRLVSAQLNRVLEGGAASARYAHLDAATRRAIGEILRATHPDF